jgi:outer membrane protein OmpA-like peptidoglycan-associated protein
MHRSNTNKKIRNSNPESSKTITEPNIIETKVIEEKTITLEKVKEEPKVEVKKEEKVPSDSKIVQKEINDILAKNKIIFERRSTTVTKKSNLVLKQIVKILKREKNVKVEVAGHTDSRGKASLNKKLSQQRANSVRKALIYYGVEKERLTAVGYGEEQPIAKDDKNGLSIVNRRVEFNIVGE